jgi:hypothetical protein
MPVASRPVGRIGTDGGNPLTSSPLFQSVPKDGLIPTQEPGWATQSGRSRCALKVIRLLKPARAERLGRTL